MTLTRAQKNRLLLLATKGVWAGATERDLQHYERLVELGLATRETVDGDYGWLYNRYRLTDAGKALAEVIATEDALKQALGKDKSR